MISIENLELSTEQTIGMSTLDLGIPIDITHGSALCPWVLKLSVQMIHLYDAIVIIQTMC